MADITVIIPITELNDSEKYQMFVKAVNSVPKGIDILVVGDENAIKSAKGKSKFNTLINDTNDTSFANQVNLAAKNIKTEFFSVLEFDDTFTDIWFTNLEKYTDTMKDVAVFLPITELFEVGAEQAEGFINEAVWATSFSDVVGYIDKECLLAYPNFNVTGGLIRTEVFNEFGGLKTSMKLTFWYEFLLRLAHNSKIIFVIPKLGYNHTINRADSYMVTSTESMTEDEADWWVDLAKKEYVFTRDRNKIYEAE